MLTVKNGNEEITVNNIQSLSQEEALNDTMELKFVSVNHRNNPGYPYLQEEAIVVLDGHEYRIKKLNDRPRYKNVTAVHCFSDLTGVRRDSKLNGTFTLQAALDFLFSGTGWTASTNLKWSAELVDFGYNNVMKLFRDLCMDTFNVEFKILPGKRIEVVDRISGDYGAQYRYGYNIKSISRETDTTNLRTRITGYGKDGLTVIYTSPNHTIFGIIEADSYTDESIETEEELRKAIEGRIDDVPKISLEVEAVHLGDNRELGETIHLTYEPMNNLKMVTRILKITRVLNADGELVPDSFTFGNSIFETVNEKLHKEIKNTQDNLSDSEKKFNVKLDVLDDRINMEVEEIGESIASINIRADRIEQSVINLDNNLSSRITQTAAEIRSEVEAEVITINNNIKTVENNVSTLSQTASSIQATVTSHTSQIGSLGTRMSSAESSIRIQADEIESKVSETDYNGNVITSKINQTSTTIDIIAGRINFVGEVFGQGATFSGDVQTDSNIRVGNSLYLGNQSSYSTTKRIYFNNNARISGGGSIGDGWGIEISSAETILSGGDVVFESDVVFDGRVEGVVKDDYGGLSLTYGSSGNTITFRRNGIYLGLIKLES